MNSMTETNRITKTDPVPLADCVKTLAIEYVPSIDQSVLYFGNNQMLYVSMTPEEILDHWCSCCGSSLRGRRDFVFQMTGIQIKRPILISESLLTMFFPMRSGRQKDSNIWICEDQIMRVVSDGRANTVVLFQNGYRLEIPYNIRMVKRQIENCRRCRKILMNYKEDLIERPLYIAAKEIN